MLICFDCTLVSWLSLWLASFIEIVAYKLPHAMAWALVKSTLWLGLVLSSVTLVLSTSFAPHAGCWTHSFTCSLCWLNQLWFLWLVSGKDLGLERVRNLGVTLIFKVVGLSVRKLTFARPQLRGGPCDSHFGHPTAHRCCDWHFRSVWTKRRRDENLCLLLSHGEPQKPGNLFPLENHRGKWIASSFWH